LKLPEPFARSLKHRNYRKRNYGGMTSDEVMNDFAKCEADRKRIEDEKKGAKKTKTRESQI
jgi:hypothetical protein